MEKIKELGAWLGKRLSERSSWLGLTAIASSVGVALSPDLQEVIIQVGIAIAGLITFLTKDKTNAVVVKK